MKILIKFCMNSFMYSFELILRYFGLSRMGPTLEPLLSSLELVWSSQEMSDMAFSFSPGWNSISKYKSSSRWWDWGSPLALSLWRNISILKYFLCSDLRSQQVQQSESQVFTDSTDIDVISFQRKNMFVLFLKVRHGINTTFYHRL